MFSVHRSLWQYNLRKYNVNNLMRPSHLTDNQLLLIMSQWPVSDPLTKHNYNNKKCIWCRNQHPLSDCQGECIDTNSSHVTLSPFVLISHVGLHISTSVYTVFHLHRVNVKVSIVFHALRQVPHVTYHRNSCFLPWLFYWIVTIITDYIFIQNLK